MNLYQKLNYLFLHMKIPISKYKIQITPLPPMGTYKCMVKKLHLLTQITK